MVPFTGFGGPAQSGPPIRGGILGGEQHMLVDTVWDRTSVRVLGHEALGVAMRTMCAWAVGQAKEE
jgi:hypothetical protein